MNIMSETVKYVVIIVAIFTVLYVLYDRNNNKEYFLNNVIQYPKNVKQYQEDVYDEGWYKLRNNPNYPEITRGDFLDTSRDSDELDDSALKTQTSGNYLDTLPKKDTYLIRNPIKNPKFKSKNMCFDENKTYIRDVDDGMKVKFTPFTNIECDFFGEKDNYKESIYRYKDTDEVDRINRFRSGNQKQFIGTSVADIFDELNGNNDVQQHTDLLNREGTSYVPANKNFKIIQDNRWHYERENSINGGVILGSNGMRGYDQNYDYAAIDITK